MSKYDKQWTEYAEKHLKGKKIVAVRYMTEQEKEDHMWYYRGLVIQLDDGSLIYPSADDEGNDAGAIFGQTNKGEHLLFPVMRD
jgi:hypothetical protein